MLHRERIFRDSEKTSLLMWKTALLCGFRIECAKNLGIQFFAGPESRAMTMGPEWFNQPEFLDDRFRLVRLRMF